MYVCMCVRVLEADSLRIPNNKETRTTKAAHCFWFSYAVFRLRVACTAAIQVGDTAPDFSLVDESGQTFTLSKNKNKNIVLFFYPADDTPGWYGQGGKTVDV